MSVAENGAGQELYPVGKNVVDEDTNFVTGDSPHVVSVKSVLGTCGNRGYIMNDGPGDIQVAIAHAESVDGTVNYAMDPYTIKNGENFDFTGLGVHSVKILWVSDSAYRLNIW